MFFNEVSLSFEGVVGYNDLLIFYKCCDYMIKKLILLYKL